MNFEATTVQGQPDDICWTLVFPHEEDNRSPKTDYWCTISAG